MPTTVAMPALSPTMTEGTLARWLVKEGDSVSAGDVIAEIETDKAAMELEAVDGGLVGRLLVAEGTEGVPVNRPIAVLLGDGEDASALDGFQPAPAAAPESTPRRSRSESSGKRIFASPLARRMAERAGLDLSAIQGTGPHGRIVKADVEVRFRRVRPRPRRRLGPRLPGRSRTRPPRGLRRRPPAKARSSRTPTCGRRSPAGSRSRSGRFPTSI